MPSSQELRSSEDTVFPSPARGRVSRAALFFSFAILPAGGAHEDTPIYRVCVLEDDQAAPVVDGRLEEEVWKSAPVLGPLLQVEPVAGAPASERTELRIVQDSNAIYLALYCFDREPHQIRDTQMERDARLNPDDRVEMLLDTFHDHRSAFWFQIGAGGSKGDALIDRNGALFNKEWDGIWDGKVRITSEGWFAELRLPLHTLNFNPQGTAWGFNVRRFIRRRNEEVRWASPSPRIQFFSVANAGVIEGFRGLRQGLGFDVVPFVVVDWQHDRLKGRRVTTFEPGADAYYRITPGTKLSVSVNTDFAETEVDDREVNLTRFPLFFPEKRDFFLEDSGNFSFAQATTSAGPGEMGAPDVLPFFSRRIGLDDEGEEVPILAAVKYTARTRDFSLGLMDVETEDLHQLDSRNLFVGRYSHNLLEQSDAGVIFTHGNPTGDESSETFGFDFNYRTDRWLGDRNLRLSTYLLKTDTSGISGDDLAYHASVRFPNDEIDILGAYTVVEDEFDPRLGFVQREGIKQYLAAFEYAPRLYSDIRQLRFELEPRLITDTGNDTETVEWSLVPLGFELESGDELEVEIERTHDRLSENFEIQEGVSIPQGSYDFTRYGISGESSSKRPIEVSAGYAFGGFYDGKATEVELGAEVRYFKHFLLGLEYEREEARLEDGDFTVRIVRARADIPFHPQLAWLNFIQYDNVSESLGLNSRLWWIVRPGHDVYFVVNQGYLYEDSGHIVSLSTQLTLKVGYTLRF